MYGKSSRYEKNKWFFLIIFPKRQVSSHHDGRIIHIFPTISTCKMSKYRSPAAQNEMQCIIFALEAVVCSGYIPVVLVFIIYWYFCVSEGKKNNDFSAETKDDPGNGWYQQATFPPWGFIINRFLLMEKCSSSQRVPEVGGG